MVSYLQQKEDPSTPMLLSMVEGGQMVFDNGVLFIDHWGWWGGWWGWRWCAWGWGWCWGY
jgi:hypothetical protein